MTQPDPDITPPPAPLPPRGKTRARIWLSSEKPMARIARNLLWLASGRGVSAVLSLIYLGVATRVLGVEQFGHFALILSMGVAIGTFAQFDCWQVIMRFGAGHLHAGRTEALGRVIATCRIFDLMGIIAGLTLAGGAALLLTHLGVWERNSARTAFLYSSAILLAVRSTPMGILRLHNRFDLSTYAETMVPITRMAGVLIALFWRPDATGFLMVWAASEMVAALAFWLFAWRVDKGVLALRHMRFFVRTMRQEKGLPGFLAVTNLGATVNGLTTQAPMLMLGGFVSTVAAGLFRLAFQLSQALSKVASLVSRSAYAELNHVRASGGTAAVRKLVARTNYISFFAALGMIGLIILLGRPLLLLIAGEEFVAAYPLLLLLGGAAAINFMGISYEPALLAATNGMVVLRLRMLLALSLLALLALCLPLWGAMGGAAAIIGNEALRYLLFRHAAGKYMR